MTRVSLRNPIVRLIVMFIALAAVWTVRPNQAARAAYYCQSIKSGAWADSATWTGCGGGYPHGTDDVLIGSGHIIDTTATTYAALNLFNYGELKMGGSFQLYGNYYAYAGSSVTGWGTFNFYGGDSSQMCAGNAVAVFAPGINFNPPGGATVTCANGFSGSLTVASGTLVLNGNSSATGVSISSNATLRLGAGVSLSSSGSLSIASNGMLDLGISGQASGSPVSNSGTVRSTRNSPGTSSTYFDLAGGPNNGFVVQPLTGGFSQLVLDWHGYDHPYKTGTGVTSGVGWGEYWVLSVTGSDSARVTVPARLFVPNSNSKVCYAASSVWDCAATSYDAVGTPNTVTRNPVTINTNLAWAAGGNVAATGDALTTNGSGNALNFDGVDDYVNVGASSPYFNTDLTVEAWVRTTDIRNGRDLVAWGNTDTCIGDNAQFRLDNGVLNFGMADVRGVTCGNYNNGWQSVVASTSIATGDWTHVAMVKSGSAITLYVNGQAVASGTINKALSLNRMAIGSLFYAGSVVDDYLAGDLDEVRVWHTARTAAQIRQNMYRELGPTTGLVANYHFNESSGVAASDSSGNNLTGTLYNFPASPWRTSGAFAGPRQALNFDGVDDYVNAGASSPAFSTDLTVEAWVRTTDTRTARDLVAWGNTDTCIGDNAQFRIDGGVLNFGMHDVRGATCGNYDNGWQSVVAATSIATGNWTHVALVKSGSSMTLYINGQSAATGTINKTLSIDRMAIGSLFYAGSAVDAYLAGDLDEVRIWNVARSASDIRQNMAHTLVGSETGLVAYYRFDQVNTADQTVLYDLTSNNAHGTLLSMDAATDWISSSAFNTWIGSESTDWSAAANWSRNAAPVAGDNLGAQIFPGSNTPALNSPTTFTSLVIAEGTTLNVATDISLTGNWLNYGTFNHTAGTVIFSGSAAQQLIGNTTFNNLTINSGAIFDLGDTASAAVNGTLINNGTIRATRSIATTGAQAFGLAGGPVNGANVSLNVTSDSFTSITLDRHDTQHAHSTGTSEANGLGYARYWAITPTGSGTINITLPANFATGADSKVCRYTGGAGSGWDCAADAYTANTVTRNGVTSFSDWATGNIGPTALTLTDLSASASPIETAPILIVLATLLGLSGLLITARRSTSIKHSSD